MHREPTTRTILITERGGIVILMAGRITGTRSRLREQLSIARDQDRSGLRTNRSIRREMRQRRPG
jgi:hypothetical protein